MQASLTLAATLDTQHSRLVTMDEFIKRLPFNYPSYYQIHTGQLKQAIETLERRRALLWPEILGLRTSINQNSYGRPPFSRQFCHGERMSRRLPWPTHERTMSMAETVTSRVWIYLVVSWGSNVHHEPVIIITHSQWRSDIIILLHNSPPSLIDTSDDFYARAIKLQDQRLGARRKGLESNTYERCATFCTQGAL
jgi:hypothetical protein